MKMEALSRRLQGCVSKVERVQGIVDLVVDAAKDPHVPVDLETMRKVNATKYAEAVQAAQASIQELKTQWPV